MQPVVHFLLSIVAGLGVGLHYDNKHKKYLLIFLLALATTCIDLDHLLPIYKENGIKILHNFFVFIVLPSFLFLVFYVHERERKSSLGQRACLLLSVMFLGHMFLDGISGTMSFFYPLHPDMFTLNNMGITLHPSFFTLTTGHVVFIIWGVLILGANMLETIIYDDVEECNMKHYDISSSKSPDNGRKSHIFTAVSGIILIKFQNLLRLKESKHRL
jgi:hypothetical protein